MAGNIARNLQTTSSVMATFVAMFTEQFNVFYFTINTVQRYNVAITFVFDLGYDIFWAILSSETSVWLATTIFSMSQWQVFVAYCAGLVWHIFLL